MRDVKSNGSITIDIEALGVYPCQTRRKEVEGNAKYESGLHEYVSPHASAQKAVFSIPQQLHQDT